MSKNSLNKLETPYLENTVSSSLSGVTGKIAKLASNGAFFVLDNKPVPKSVPYKNYRKRFVKTLKPYKLPTIVRAKDGWFVRYYYEIPFLPGKFKEFRVRDGINYIHDSEMRETAIQQLVEDIKYALEKTEYNPFDQDISATIQIAEAQENIKKQQALMALEKALDWYINEKKGKGKTDSTIDTYKLHINRLITWCKKHNLFRIDDVKIDDIELFLSEHLESEEWSARTYNNNIMFITTFFNYLVAKRKLPINPIGPGMLERISNRAEKNKYYDQATLNKIFPAVAKKPLLRRFMLWTYYSCARGTELRALRIRDIDLNVKKITIMAETGKTGAYVGKRSIPICQELMDIIIEEKLMDNPEDWYIFGKAGNIGPDEIQKDYFADVYHEIKKKLKIDFKYTIYSLKHTRVVDLLIAEFDPIKVMHITGHTDWGSFQKYMRELGAVMDKQLIGNTLKLNL